MEAALQPRSKREGPRGAPHPTPLPPASCIRLAVLLARLRSERNFWALLVECEPCRRREQLVGTFSGNRVEVTTPSSKPAFQGSRRALGPRGILSHCGSEHSAPRTPRCDADTCTKVGVKEESLQHSKLSR